MTIQSPREENDFLTLAVEISEFYGKKKKKTQSIKSFPFQNISVCIKMLNLSFSEHYLTLKIKGEENNGKELFQITIELQIHFQITP